MLHVEMKARGIRGPVTDVEGAYVRALRETLDLSHMDFATKLGKEKATVVRWEKKAVDSITWRGILVTLGLPQDWEPKADILARARLDLAKLKPAK